MGNLFAELKRRHIYRVAAAYAVVAWVLLQLVNNLAPIFELPPWIPRAVVLLPSDRFLERLERDREIQQGFVTYITTIWLPLYAPLRKTERFKAFMRSAGLVDYWRARGWPDLCRPVGADDFVCE